jgi:Lecithin:cholesterol acyltransferase
LQLPTTAPRRLSVTINVSLRPLLVVPALFGTELHDDEQGPIWGTFRCLYRGPRLASLAGMRGKPGNVIGAIPLFAGLRYDILGALQRALGRAGYEPGRNLHLFAYDWRLRSVDVANALVHQVRQLATANQGEVDLLGLSNGGLLVRAAFAIDPALPVERVVTSGAPLAGSLESLACLNVGFQFAPLGRTVSPGEFVSCPGSLDCLPPPDSPIFLEPGYDLYDAATWKALRLSVFGDCRGGRDEEDEWTRVLGERLSATRQSWLTLGRAGAPRHLACVCGAGRPTQVKIVIDKGRARLPGEGRGVARLPAEALADGDGGVSVESAAAWDGAQPEVIRIPVGRHRDVVRTPAAFRAILDSLS